MKAVGKLGSYISKSVYTVSGPFHPFGGAVDIIVVEQQDGSFKSSPWYVRFGKFQGVLKANEKVVSISVNGVEADFHMYLDHKGEAYFLKELDVEEGDSLSSPSSSGEDTDGQSHDRRPMKSKSCNYDAYESDSVTQIDLCNGNVISRSNSRRARILGLVFGRKSMKKDNNNFPEEGNDAGVIRSESMESAEIAADLLEVKWSTNLASPRQTKENTSLPFSQDISEANDNKDLMIKDGQTLLRDDIMDNSISLSEIGIDNNEESYSFRSIPTKSDRSVEDTGVGTSCLISAEDDGKPNLNLSRKTDNLWAADTDTSASMIGDTSAIAITESQIQDSVKLEECPGNKYQIDQVSKEMHDGFTDSSFSAEENRVGRIPAFLYCETSMRSELDGSNKRANGALCLSIGGCEQVFVETMQTANFACEVSSEPATGLNEKEPSNIDGKTPQNVVTSSSSTENGFVAETFSQMITLEPVYASAEDIESGSIFTISTFSNSTCQALVEKTVPEEDEISQRETPVKPVVDPIQLNLLSSEISEEERLLFGDFDDFKLSSVRYSEEPDPPNDEKEGDPPCLQTETEGVNENFMPICIPGLSAEKSIHVNLPENAKDLRRLKTISSHIDIPATCGSQSEEVSRAARSLPNMSAHNYDLCAHDLGQSLYRSIDSDSKLLNQIDFLSNVETEAENDTSQTIKDTESIEKLTKGLPNPAVGDCSRSFDVPNGSRGTWSFPFKRSRSMKVSQVVSDSNKRSDENTTNRKVSTEGEKDLPTVKVTKNKTRSITPTSEQLASLKLKEGRNSVVFTFSTPMLGKQQVDARIYLWKWDTRVVISDVDGTITRSDLLGQFMPLVGVDWSQTGVAHLFSAIKENGYQLLFLSARAISQAYHTRQFLFNLKQDGKVLPEGPVVISPDGLFPSLYREVVRRAPHEFKIACLEDIKALFPSDRNPFYAGFGNRDTDEISYLKVGIPKGKIFIINPKGEIVVNRRIDTKSYTSLHAYVPDMFPPMSSCELEDFNSWNYWKLPPPAIDV